jgi:hypothetical protein
VKLSRGACRFLDLIRWYRTRFGRVFPFQEKLATHLGVTCRQIRRYIRELVDGLLLRVHKCGHHAAEYELAPEAVTENVRSTSGLRPVVASGPLNTVSAPQRKPAQKENVFGGGNWKDDPEICELLGYRRMRL